MLLCDFVHRYVCVHVCEIDWCPVLSVTWVTWHIDVRSKHCSFACLWRGELMKPRLPGVHVFFIIDGGSEIERERMQCMCFPH